MSDYERELFSLVGARNKSARMKLYRFMLENMSDDQVKYVSTNSLNLLDFTDALKAKISVPKSILIGNFSEISNNI